MTNKAKNRITINPAICNGKPTIRGLRITVQTVLEYLGTGESREEILNQFPMLEPEDIDACSLPSDQRHEGETSMKLTLETDREDDGRWIVEAPELPGVLCYGATQREAMAKAAALALRVIAEQLDPEQLDLSPEDLR